MSQVHLHRLHIVPVLQGKDSKGVPLRYNNDKPEEPSIFNGFRGFKPGF